MNPDTADMLALDAAEMIASSSGLGSFIASLGSMASP